MGTPSSAGAPLRRSLGFVDAVFIGLASMIGAGIFAALGPAARAAGSGLLVGLLIAGAVAYCNATSSARLAALYPLSGGTYVYGSRRLGPFWGYLAGWGFVVGKTASCAAMALTVGNYAWPEHSRLAAVAAVLAVTAVNHAGVQKSAMASTVIVVIVVAGLSAVVGAVFVSGAGDVTNLRIPEGTSVGGVLQAAGMLFFAFAGYARLATLGEEVVDPARTIPRAVSTALAIALALYAVVAIAVLVALGPAGLAAASAPLADAVRVTGAGWLVPAVTGVATLAAAGSLLSLQVGVSRTMLAMARDRHLPAALVAVHPRTSVPHRAEWTVGAIVVALVLTLDLRGAIGFSSFTVLVYYVIANASAWTLRPGEGRPARWIPLVGLLGCALLAVALPPPSVLAGAAVLAVGAVVYVLRNPDRGS